MNDPLFIKIPAIAYSQCAAPVQEYYWVSPAEEEDLCSVETEGVAQRLIAHRQEHISIQNPIKSLRVFDSNSKSPKIIKLNPNNYQNDLLQASDKEYFQESSSLYNSSQGENSS